MCCGRTPEGERPLSAEREDRGGKTSTMVCSNQRCDLLRCVRRTMVLIPKPHSFHLDDRSEDHVLKPILGHALRFDPVTE